MKIKKVKRIIIKKKLFLIQEIAVICLWIREDELIMFYILHSFVIYLFLKIVLVLKNGVFKYINCNEKSFFLLFNHNFIKKPQNFKCIIGRSKASFTKIYFSFTNYDYYKYLPFQKF